MDDISSINSDGVFEEDISHIYPDSLTLTKENQGHLSADILDLTVNLDAQAKKFVFKLYDKRDKFKFSIVNYPEINSNISTKCCHGVVKSELKRYATLSSNISDYILRKDTLFNKLLRKGYCGNKLNQLFNSIKFNS